ncbi:alpha/beta-hydrolase [Byssothecium circinans]|uniref:Carboxylic ester hydrolase n=1 Tax=Byssothecium circinans TaxID=147558 RepID=A0A6A5UA86_9PLEO|nr:alpha/beta-hydrolase [Byssothecium circinans]
MMKLLLFIFTAITSFTIAFPTAKSFDSGVIYTGIERNGIEVFLGIQYGEDTYGANRFAPPKPFIPKPGSSIDATKPGLPCPQQLGQWNAPLTLLNVTEVSEDCLNLNIARPAESKIPKEGLPVMVWIHGGSFWVGSNMEPTHQPDGLVRESVEAGNPVIHVAINYRLGFFGFSQNAALKEKKSENAGLRDQRLAIEWVRDHIKYFGGNGNKITIHGQSSGGLAVGIQLLAYGGTKPLPYQRGIAQSQALEPGIVAPITSDGQPLTLLGREAFRNVVTYLNCTSVTSNSTADIDKQEVIDCLRSKDTQTLLNASLATYIGDIAHNIGDVWLPSVDGDFLPDAPSKLLNEGRFGNATYMIGWMQGDLDYFTNFSISSESDVFDFIHAYLPGLDTELLTKQGGLLDRYPVSEFHPPAGTNLTANFYRASRIFRDIVMVCEPLYMAEALNRYGNQVYLYNWNQTILPPILTALYNISGLGVIHTSEFAYIYGNLSAYNVSEYPFNPSQQDYDLMHRGSRSWTAFAAKGRVDESDGGVKGLKQAYWGDEMYGAPDPGYPYIYTFGGDMEGLFPIEGNESPEVVRGQRLAERCAAWNTPKIISQIGF